MILKNVNMIIMDSHLQLGLAFVVPGVRGILKQASVKKVYNGLQGY